MYKITNDQQKWSVRADLDEAKKLAKSIQGVVIEGERIIYDGKRGYCGDYSVPFRLDAPKQLSFIQRVIKFWFK